MKLISKSNKGFIIIFERGEELIAGITSYCEQKHISAAWLHALGACGKLTLAWYNLETKEYEDHEYQEDIEIAAITGNVALISDKPFVHVHGIFGKRDMSTIGGHIRKIVISATCEVKLDIFTGKFQRVYDDITGLNLLDRCGV